MSHIGNDAVIDAQRDELETSVHPDPAILQMHGKCNSCGKKMYMIGLKNGERKTHRYNSNSTACFYGRLERRTLAVLWVTSPCCEALIRRANATGFEGVNQYVQI